MIHKAVQILTASQSLFGKNCDSETLALSSLWLFYLLYLTVFNWEEGERANWNPQEEGFTAHVIVPGYAVASTQLYGWN